MKKLFVIFLLGLSITGYSQKSDVIDFKNFNEEKMNEVMFDEMNRYVKYLHTGDSLVLSSVVQNQIMRDNYYYLKEHKDDPIQFLHNPKWNQNEYNNLPDSLRNQIIEELKSKYPKSGFLDGNWIEPIHDYGSFTYTEILVKGSFLNCKCLYTYQMLALEIIRGWNNSPEHALYMNANYRNQVIVGVTTFYDTPTQTLILSFVHIF